MMIEEMRKCSCLSESESRYCVLRLPYPLPIKISRAYNTGRSDRALNGSSISEIFCPRGCCNPKRVSHKNSNFVEGNGPGSQDYSIPISRQ